MASTYIVYYSEKHDGTREHFCFTCAVKKAVNRDAPDLHIETSDYEYEHCSECGNRIYDNISI